MIKRSLAAEQVKNKKSGHIYPNFKKDLELHAYCLMPNHFHILIKTRGRPKLLAELMRSVITAYSMYFNQKYDRSGPLFGSRYRAVRITKDDQLAHISRYIHMNPLGIGREYSNYEYSSLPHYLGQKQADWLQVGEMMNLFNNDSKEYIRFLDDFREKHKELAAQKKKLY